MVHMIFWLEIIRSSCLWINIVWYQLTLSLRKYYQNSGDWLYWEMYKYYGESINDSSVSNIGVDFYVQPTNKCRWPLKYMAIMELGRHSIQYYQVISTKFR